ncbi:hypothetical protein SEA_ODAY_20 [Gordonia phage ODay]|nr:hypothetical protein SEA_ODAY_20 [Gordonia phage ODay]
MSDLRSALTSIYKDRGELTPQVVVEEARPDDHPLHNRFEWDNELAGDAYRRVQAQELIRSVKIVFTETPEGEKKTIRAFSSLRGHNDDNTRRGYQPTEELVQDEFSRTLLLRQCRREIAALSAKYGHLEEFAAMMTEAIA